MAQGVTKDQLEKEESRIKIDVGKSEIRRNDAVAAKVRAEQRHIEREADIEDASEYQAGIYSFIGKVNQDNVSECVTTLGELSRLQPGRDITVIFNSPGGSVIDGFALYDFLEELEEKDHYITTVGRGWTASMGGILLQAGNDRVIGKNAHMLIHEVSSMGVGKLSEMEDELKFTRRLQARCLKILASKSNMTEKQISNKWTRKDWWLDADEVVKHGFADRIG